MSRLSIHQVLTQHGSSTLLDWVANHKHRYYVTFDETEALRKIARVEDVDARNLLLSLLQDCERLRDMVIEMHKDFDMLSTALSGIADKEDTDTPAAPGEAP